MYNLLFKLYLITALMQLGISLTDLGSLSSLSNLKKIDQASKEVLHIKWKPISVFPNEAKRFQ